MTDWTDLAPRIQTAGRDKLGQPALYTAGLEDPVPVRVIFRPEAELVTLEDGVPTSTSRIVASIHAADLDAAPAQGDSIEISGVAYRVVDTEPDGHGDVDLILHRS